MPQEQISPDISNKTTQLESVLFSAMAEIREDKELFKKFTITDSYLKKYTDLCGNTKVFDFWYDKFSEVHQKVSEINKVIQLFKQEIHNLFSKCHTAAQELKEGLKKFPNYSIVRCEGNIDIMNRKISIMVLFETAEAKEPESLSDYNDFLDEVYKVQENCNKKFSPLNFDFRTLFFDDTVNIESIAQDFPLPILK